MLIIADTFNKLDFPSLMQVYSEGNLENGEEFYPHEPRERQIILAERNFEKYLREDFFLKPGGKYYILTDNEKYVSALRLEPFRDGYLLEALETAPSQRRKGYGKQLMASVLKYLPKGTKVYSEVSKKNEASLKTHESCGFSRLLDHWIDEDGTVYHGAFTLMDIT